MAIEFGILREGFSTTHIGEFRVETWEEVFWEQDPLWEQAQSRTGIELNAFGQARFEGTQLQVFEELISCHPRAALSEDAQALLGEINRLALQALRTNKALTFFGV